MIEDDNPLAMKAVFRLSTATESDWSGLAIVTRTVTGTVTTEMVWVGPPRIRCIFEAALNSVSDFISALYCHSDQMRSWREHELLAEKQMCLF